MSEKMKRKEERTGGKSNFSITCSLLSQYLKEKGSFGKLGLEMHAVPRPLDQQRNKGSLESSAEKLRGPPTTMTLLPGAYVSDDDERTEDRTARGDPKSVDLFPRHAGFGSPINILPLQEEPREAAGSNNYGDWVREVERAQLTIFYGGKVLVFDDFPSDKAMDLVQTCSLNSSPPAPVTPVSTPECSPRPPLPVSSASANQAPALAVAASEKCLAKSDQGSASDMPIARRNSLHRFLEKRKDRIITKAPYEVPGGSPVRPDEAKPENSKPFLSPGPDASKPESSKSWLSQPDEAKPESSKSWLSVRTDEAKPENSKSWLGLGRRDSKSEDSSGSSR